MPSGLIDCSYDGLYEIVPCGFLSPLVVKVGHTLLYPSQWHVLINLISCIYSWVVLSLINYWSATFKVLCSTLQFTGMYCLQGVSTTLHKSYR